MEIYVNGYLVYNIRYIEATLVTHGHGYLPDLTCQVPKFDFQYSENLKDKFCTLREFVYIIIKYRSRVEYNTFIKVIVNFCAAVLWWESRSI